MIIFYIPGLLVKLSGKHVLCLLLKEPHFLVVIKSKEARDDLRNVVTKTSDE